MMRRTAVELARLQGSVAALADQMRMLQDHEVRMRRVERLMYGVPAAGLVAIASVVNSFIRH